MVLDCNLHSRVGTNNVSSVEYILKMTRLHPIRAHVLIAYSIADATAVRELEICASAPVSGALKEKLDLHTSMCT